MDKIRILLDVDNTIISTDLAIADHYNNFMHNHKNFKIANGEEIYYYDGRTQLPLYSREKFMSIFESDFFWNNVQVKENAKSVIEKLCNDERFDVCLWSYGSLKNLSKKSNFINKHFGKLVEEKILDVILSNNVNVEKHEICDKGIIVDDHHDNLVNKNAYNICFADFGNKDWNKNHDGMFVTNWLDLYELINSIYEFEIRKYYD